MHFKSKFPVTTVLHVRAHSLLTLCVNTGAKSFMDTSVIGDTAGGQ